MQAMNTPKIVMAVAEDTLPTCTMCHRKFGTSSFTIHLVQCGKKNFKSKEIVDGMIYKYLNPPIVVKQEGVRGGGGMSKGDREELIGFVEKKMEKVNIEAYDAFMDQRKECMGCHRKFAEDRIDKHQSICKGK